LFIVAVCTEQRNAVDFRRDLSAELGYSIQNQYKQLNPIGFYAMLVSAAGSLPAAGKRPTKG